jgi:restriction system protein
MKLKESKNSPSKQTGAKTIYKSFELLRDAGGEMSRKELLGKMTAEIDFNEWEKERYESNGQPRWLTVFLFYTVDCLKAGYLIKNKGTWILTPEGEDAMTLGSYGLIDAANKAYREWDRQQKLLKQNSIDTDLPGVDDEPEKKAAVELEVIEEQAQDEIINFINSKNPYEFQDLVAKLLEAMGYFIDFVAPKGKDGGIDVIAYQDELGVNKPRIKVQVKHYPKNPIGPEPVRSLKGLLNSSDEIGLFVTSGSFTAEAKRTARDSAIHIRLMDGAELIGLWQKHYANMSDENKSLLPLQAIYFLKLID